MSKKTLTLLLHSLLNPIYVLEISSGKKRYEFRKTLYKRRDVKTIVVYCSSPVCRLVGEIDVDKVLCDTPEHIWDLTESEAGVSKSFYSHYFEGKDIAYAIKIKRFRPYIKPIKLSERYPGVTPPQSFCYLEGEKR